MELSIAVVFPFRDDRQIAASAGRIRRRRKRTVILTAVAIVKVAVVASFT